MKNLKSLNQSFEHHVEQARLWDLKEWNEKIPHIKAEFIAELIPAASNHYDPIHWKEKLHTLVNIIKELPSLESIGKLISLEQLHEILFWYSNQADKNLVDKIALMFSSVPPNLFFGLIVRISNEQLSLLQKIASLPPIEYHLSFLSHEIKERFNRLCKKIEQLENTIIGINFSTLKPIEIEQLYENIQELQHDALEIKHVSSIGLAIVWNTNRMDIIQELSRVKELCHKCLLDVIGTKGQDDGHANSESHEILSSGLWNSLQNKLDEVFSVRGTSDVIIKMHDDDPALEALNVFSIWHLKDYYEIGLLKGSALSNISDLNSSDFLNSSLQQTSESLFEHVKANLERSGLKTLKDLKREHIYSKQALIDYIASHLS